jgi:hypothetical protein
MNEHYYCLSRTAVPHGPQGAVGADEMRMSTRCNLYIGHSIRDGNRVVLRADAIIGYYRVRAAR